MGAMNAAPHLSPAQKLAARTARCSHTASSTTASSMISAPSRLPPSSEVS